jgi:20S proteasome alpha/beta subunit
LSAWKATAIGKNSDKVNELLEASFEENMNYNKSLTLVVDCMLQYVEAGSKNMEIAIMAVGSQLEQVKDADIDKVIAEIEEKKKKEEGGPKK